MNFQRKDAAQTRRRLLDSASTVFADKGYRAATIAEICEKAGANIAAVNYHFGSKERLYVDAWKYAFGESVKAYPPDGGVSADAPPEERLRGHIRALIRRIADRGNREFRIMQQEIFDPTDLLREVTREMLDALRMDTLGLVRELLGPCVPEEHVVFSEMSIVNQCINPIIAGRPGRGKGMKKEPEDRMKINIEAYIGHVTGFSLAGLKAVRMEYEGKDGMVKKKKGRV
jgi:AcrR family transcriptional regulator